MNGFGVLTFNLLLCGYFGISSYLQGGNKIHALDDTGRSQMIYFVIGRTILDPHYSKFGSFYPTTNEWSQNEESTPNYPISALETF